MSRACERNKLRMLDARIRALWDRLARPVGTAIGRSGIDPNTITVIGVLIQVGTAALIVDGRLLAAGIMTIVAGLADLADGAVAKARNLQSRFGALLDSTTDRLSDALIFGALAWLYAGTDGQQWAGALALATLVASFLVSYVKARAEGLGFECNVGIVERAERIILICAGLILDLVPVMLSVLFVLSVVTFVQRLVHVRRQGRVGG